MLTVCSVRRARARGVGPSVGLVLLAAVVGAVAPTPVLADVPPYSLVGTFSAPTGTWDVLPDGRVIGLTGATFVVESAPGAGDYGALGSVDPALISPFGATFIRVSPDGSRIAIGDNNFGPSASVLLVNAAALNLGGPAPVASVAAANTEAVWTSNSTLFVSGFGSSPSVSRIDADALTAALVVDNVGSGSGGVASDGTRLFVGVGFDFGPAGGDTGLVRAFDLASLGGLASPPVEFDSGAAVADALSASSLGFDALGNLLVGGGDFFAGSDDFGYAAVVDAAAVAAALAGGPISPDAAELRLSPFGPGAFYSVRFNAFTGELLVSDGALIARYAVPAPAAGAALALAGVFAARRRRNG